MDEPRRFDLEAYLGRIGFEGERRPTRALLEALHAAHMGEIPFENIDVRLGRRVDLDLESLQAKLVRGGRGGYCFEQNTLFCAALRELGFEVATLEARVRPPGATAPLPRTHMVLRVEAGGGSWLADVGFGGDGPLLPVPLDSAVSEQHDGAYRIAFEDHGLHVLRKRQDDAWRDLYAFTLVPALPVDYEVANHFTSTHPDSVFVNNLSVQRSTPARRLFLRGRTFTIREGGRDVVREIAETELPSLLRESFGLSLSDGDLRRLARKLPPSETV